MAEQWQFDELFDEDEPEQAAEILSDEMEDSELDLIKSGRSSIFTKILVVSCLVSIYAYVVASFWFFWHFQMVPDSLNYTFLPAIFGQLGVMATITRKDKEVEIAYLKYTSEIRIAELRVKEAELKKEAA